MKSLSTLQWPEAGFLGLCVLLVCSSAALALASRPPLLGCMSSDSLALKDGRPEQPPTLFSSPVRLGQQCPRSGIRAKMGAFAKLPTSAAEKWTLCLVPALWASLCGSRQLGHHQPPPTLRRRSGALSLRSASPGRSSKTALCSKGAAKGAKGASWCVALLLVMRGTLIVRCRRNRTL